VKIFENRVLGGIFGPTSYEVIGGWRKLHNLYSSANIMRMMKSKRKRYTGYVA
jgi:hypothetical protein